jgi:Proprotein convertase P-domain
MKKRLVLSAMLYLIGLIANGQSCFIPIFDNEVASVNINVSQLGPNDLGQNPLQRVCFKITHPWIGDLCISLKSPSGNHYLLMADDDNTIGGCGTDETDVDVCIEIGNLKPLTSNTPYFCNSGAACLSGNWTVPCGGVEDPMTGAVQAPNCDLNDFNTPGQPVNGSWTFYISDVCSQDVGALEEVYLHFASGSYTCCGESPAATCSSAPLINCSCLENGYGAQTYAPNVTDIPPSFCGSIENEQWIAFEACWCAVNLTIETGDSQAGGGVEAQLYTSCSPGFTPKTNCISIAPNSVGGFYGIDCVPGNIYYLMIDGVDGDSINYEVTAAPAPEQPVNILLDTIFGPVRVCEGDTVSYFAPPVMNAAHCDRTYTRWGDGRFWA